MNECTFAAEPAQLKNLLELQILGRTWRRVRNLDVQVEPERIVLHGLACSYYLKQLAQQTVREMLPSIGLENRICVDYALGLVPMVNWN